MPDVTLRCLHHAGGTPRFFRDWQRSVPAGVRVLAPAYAHENPRPADLGELVERVCATIDPADGPTVLYGHSMGAAVAWETCLRLRDEHRPAPLALLVGAAAAPDPAAVRMLAHGAARSVEQDATLPGFVRERTLRHLELVRAHVPSRGRLDVPVIAFAGTRDPVVSVRSMHRWAGATSSWSAVHRVGGGHLFPRERPGEFLAALGGVLTDVLAGAREAARAGGPGATASQVVPAPGQGRTAYPGRGPGQWVQAGR